MLLSHFFLPFYLKMYFFFKPTVFNVVWESYQKISWGHLQYISFYLENIFVFSRMSSLYTIFLTVSLRFFKVFKIFLVLIILYCLKTVPKYTSSSFNSFACPSRWQILFCLRLFYEETLFFNFLYKLFNKYLSVPQSTCQFWVLVRK